MNRLKNFYIDRCFLCGNMCGAKRYHGETGLCNADDRIKIASKSLHFGEEPPISGNDGSGTIFFSNCSMKCIYCQNYPISQLGVGNMTDEQGLKEAMLDLQKKGARNINFVTPTHYIYHIYSVVKEIKCKELKIPIIWNTSSYENPDVVDFLDEIVDVYLADIRYSNDNDAKKYSSVDNYVSIVFKNIKKFFKQKGYLEVDKDGYAQKGLIIRILLLPGKVKEMKEIIKFCFDNFGREISLSLMSQYTPYFKALDDLLLKRKVYVEEYEEIVDYANMLGLENCFIQEFDNMEEK
ncbi:MAG: radical SAM protein [candidate division WOR-3 bacterium]